MSYPANLKYTAHDEWISPAEGGKAKVGISFFAQKELGDIAFVELPEVGKSFGAGEVFGSIESVKAAADLYLPVAGTITAVNATLVDSEDWGAVNRDPYNEGWLVEIEVSNPADYDALLDATAYAEGK